MSPTVTDQNLVRHEYGHATHMKIVGITKYTCLIAIPSAIQFWRHKDDSNFNYYSQPWECIADMFGNVDPTTRDYLPNAQTDAIKYFLFTIII